MVLADGDPILEKELRKMDIISFLHRILALRKKQLSQSADSEGDSFGRN